MPQIEVSFEIDVNGILKVAAQDQGTGKEQSIVISHTGGLSGTEIEKMRQDAEQYAAQDQIRLRMMELQNQADSLFHTYEATLKENGDLVRDELKFSSRQKKDQLAIALRTPDLAVEKLQTLVEEFRQVILLIGTEVYQQGQGVDNNEFAKFSMGTSSGMSQMIEPLETNVRTHQIGPKTTVSPGTMINATVTPNSIDYVETSPVYGLDDGEEFDFDADETVYSDYEAID